MSKEIIRTCLACRAKEDKGRLLRFVRACDGEIIFDYKSLLPNRGVWLCPEVKCLNKAFDKKILFKDQPTLPVEKKVMLEHVKARVKQRTLSRFGLMRRMGLCEVGRDAVKRLIAHKDIEKIVVIASDLAQRSKDEILFGIDDSTRENVLQAPLLMEEIGASLGRNKTGVVAFLQGRISNELRVDLESLVSLSR